VHHAGTLVPAAAVAAAATIRSKLAVGGAAPAAKPAMPPRGAAARLAAVAAAPAALATGKIQVHRHSIAATSGGTCCQHARQTLPIERLIVRHVANERTHIYSVLYSQLGVKQPITTAYFCDMQAPQEVASSSAPAVPTDKVQQPVH